MISKRIRQIIALLQDISLYIRLKAKNIGTQSSRSILIEVNHPNIYHRYFYNLLKTLQIGGYEIYYPMIFSKFRNLRNGDSYLALIFKDNLITINKPKDPSKCIKLDDTMFSANYYKTLFQDYNDENESFHIPMSFHPNMYVENLWNIDINESNPLRINALFCFGNFDAEVYKTIHKSPFKIVDRIDLINFFRTKENFVSVASKTELQSIIQQNLAKYFIFSEKYNHNIKLQDVRPILSQFRFFLCCPGVFAPLSHNFVEALSVGCIPIIQQSYADSIYPALTNGENSIIFEDLNDLDNIVSNLLFEMTEAEYLQLKNGANLYYQTYLHPKSVAKNIIANLQKFPIYLNASEKSIKLL